jgi:tRNA pseudouridine55 synthase
MGHGRQGVEVDRPARQVVVHRLDVHPTATAGVFRMEVECSAGTYVRALGAELGRALGGGAHVRALTRTAVGSFTRAEARPVEALSGDAVLSPAEALRDHPAVVAGPELLGAVAHGAVLDAGELDAAGAGPWAVVDPDGRLVAVYEAHGDGRVKPAVVLAGL